ncbi:MAG: N-acetyl-gamma-glutamyl-phosphate reductase [Slackia sp.]
MQHAQRLVEAGVSVIDLSADFRFSDESRYESVYKTPHTAPELLERAVYGQPETMHAELARLAEEHARGNAVVVGCAGCYVTASILAAAPAMHAGLAQETSTVVIDAISGVTGAGRKATAKTHFCSADENVEVYGLPHHRHAPEIAQAYARLHPRLDEKELARVIFTPHLAPLRRGLLSTVYVPLRKNHDPRASRALRKALRRRNVGLRAPRGIWPKTASVEGTAHAHVNVSVNEEEQIAVCMCAIDNLGKGASAQAVQCANIVCGLPENTGLELLACIP